MMVVLVEINGIEYMLQRTPVRVDGTFFLQYTVFLELQSFFDNRGAC
jgi:hypothetical protein